MTTDLRSIELWYATSLSKLPNDIKNSENIGTFKKETENPPFQGMLWSRDKKRKILGYFKADIGICLDRRLNKLYYKVRASL